MMVSTLKVPSAISEHHKLTSMERSNSGRRRVFVQTETGCVVGLQLDRSDNAHTVKRRMQLALNVPTEETSLVCGDVVLKNDLSTVRNDSPLLLTRNQIHRSSSTPCLSPCGSDFQEEDHTGPVEIIGCRRHFSRTKNLVRDVVDGIECGIDPVPISSGLGGSYYFRNSDGLNVAIVKPNDEEPLAPNNPKGFVGKALGLPGIKHSVRVGEAGFREVAAYLLDHDGFANVPLTALVNITHSVFNVNTNSNSKKRLVSKIASFQQFIPHEFDADDRGSSSFPVSAVHRIGILDARILNTDRHAGNLLVRKHSGGRRFDRFDLIPIDHGLCLPEDLEDPYFEWINWPQALIPFSEDELKYIEKLDPFGDSEILRKELPMIREASLRVLILCTTFLKEAAGAGLCLAEIGEMMSREFCIHNGGPSELEMICIEASDVLKVSEAVGPVIVGDSDSDEFLFQLDCGDESKEKSEIQGSLVSLDESNQQGISFSSVTKMSKSVKNRNPGRLCVNRSVNERVSLISSCVKLSDMAEEEWQAFLDEFQRVLFSALVKRRAGDADFRQRQRMGTSCKF